MLSFSFSPQEASEKGFPGVGLMTTPDNNQGPTEWNNIPYILISLRLSLWNSTQLTFRASHVPRKQISLACSQTLYWLFSGTFPKVTIKDHKILGVLNQFAESQISSPSFRSFSRWENKFGLILFPSKELFLNLKCFLLCYIAERILNLMSDKSKFISYPCHLGLLLLLLSLPLFKDCIRYRGASFASCATWYFTPFTPIRKSHTLWFSHSFRIYFFYLQRAYCDSSLGTYFSWILKKSIGNWVKQSFFSWAFFNIKIELSKLSSEILGPSSLLLPLLRETMDICQVFIPKILVISVVCSRPSKN